MEFYLLNEDFTNIGILDRITEAHITRRFTSPGEISVTSAVEHRVPAEARYICDPESGTCAVIEQYSYNSEVGTTVSGRTLECLLERQMITSQGHYGGNVETGVQVIVMKYAMMSGAVPNLVLGESAGLEAEVNIRLEQVPLSDWLYSILTPYGASFTVTLDPTCDKLYFNVVTGTDRTFDQSEVAPVVFCEDEGGLFGLKYVRDISDHANTAYVMGNDGKSVTVPEDAPTGLARRETIVWARDIYPSSFDTEDEYLEALYERGITKLSEYGERVSVSGYVGNGAGPVLNTDYFLGDLCEVEAVGGEVSCTARITEVTDTYKDGVKLTLVRLGDGEVTLSELVRRETVKY